MALPASYQTVEVRGRYVDMLGQPVAGKVSFTASVVAITAPTEQVTVVSTPITATLDAAGEFSVLLPATDDPDVNPRGFTYLVREDFVGAQGRSFSIEVPLSAQLAGIDLATAAPVSTDTTSTGRNTTGQGTISTVTAAQTITFQANVDVYDVLPGAAGVIVEQFASTWAGRIVTLRYISEVRMNVNGEVRTFDQNDSTIFIYTGTHWHLLSHAAVANT